MVQVSKKKECDAKIFIKLVVKFPQFKIPANTLLARRQSSDLVKKAITAGQTGEKRFYIRLPEQDSHSTHPIGKVNIFIAPTYCISPLNSHFFSLPLIISY